MKIKLRGSRSEDVEAANKALGLSSTPDDYSWHHLDDFNVSTGEATMQLVKTATHQLTLPHTGAVKQYEIFHNVKYRP